VSETKTFEVTCIVCPTGCRAKVTVIDGDVKVEGVECPRGSEYAVKEITAPTRDFFTTLPIKGGNVPTCPVRSTQPVPKEMVINCAKEMAKITLEAPLKVGDIVMKNVLGLGIDIVATRDVDRETLRS